MQRILNPERELRKKIAILEHSFRAACNDSVREKIIIALEKMMKELEELIKLNNGEPITKMTY